MARWMKMLSACTAVLTITFALLHRLGTGAIWLPLAITAGTCCYHLVMRLIVGSTVDRVMGNKADLDKSWYKIHPVEEKLYDFLKVRAWKGKMPTYNPEQFVLRNRNFDALAQVMCQAEVVHECIIPLSFLPLLAARWFGALPVFLLTSLAAAAFDLLFVILQRYNRPRVLMMAQRQRQRTQR